MDSDLRSETRTLARIWRGKAEALSPAGASVVYSRIFDSIKARVYRECAEELERALAAAKEE